MTQNHRAADSDSSSHAKTLALSRLWRTPHHNPSPEPILSWWGTTIAIVLYCNRNIVLRIREFCLREARHREGAAEDRLGADGYCSECFACLPRAITSLEEDRLSKVEVTPFLGKTKAFLEEFSSAPDCAWKELSLVWNPRPRRLKSYEIHADRSAPS